MTNRRALTATRGRRAFSLGLSLCCGAIIVQAVGCTSPREYVGNRLKVGPNYSTPAASVAPDWIDASDKRVRTDADDLAGWWTILNDPLLDQLVIDAYRQNLTLREAGYRVLAARAQAGIAAGNLFPQQQNAAGGYQRFGVGDNFFSQFNFGFNVSWELDFWGRYRRAVLAAEANLDASVFEFDDVLVTLLSDVASAYVDVRTNEERIRLLENIIRVQRDVLAFISERLAAGRGVTDLDRAQARSNLKQSEASLNQLRIALRLAENRLCILLGLPVTDLAPMLKSAPKTTIPLAPDYVVVGIPADLLRRRPDVRRAERIAAREAEQIGIAEAALYPAISINGTLGWSAQAFSDLFSPQALNSSVGPSFQWNVLNYGRLVNSVRLQEAVFQQAVAGYQSTVLQAGLEVENGIVSYLQSQERLKNLDESVAEAYRALEVVVAQYEAGAAGVDFNRYATIQQTLVTQQDLWVQSRGDVAQSLIDVYRALGGGWQIRKSSPPDKKGVLTPPPLAEDVVQPAEMLPNPPVPE